MRIPDSADTKVSWKGASSEYPGRFAVGFNMIWGNAALLLDNLNHIALRIKRREDELRLR